MLFTAVEKKNKSIFLFIYLILICFSLPVFAYGQSDDLSDYLRIATANEQSSLNSRTRVMTSTAEVTLTNTSTRTIASPLHAAIEISASGVQMPEALGGIGTDPYGKYYYDLSDRLPGGILAPGEQVTFGVKFVRSYTVRFTYNVLPYGLLSPEENPEIQVSPSPLDFGEVTVGNSATKLLTVSNTGTAPLSVTSITSSDEPFTVYPPTGFSVAPGASRQVEVGFSPTTTGSAAGTITIAGNAANQDPVTISVIGEGVAPSGSPVLNAPTAIDFGAVMEEQPATKEVTVSNTGTAPLVVSEATLAGDGFGWPTTGAPELPSTLAPNQSANLQIAFTPESGTGGTTLSGTLSLVSDGGNTDVALNGNAVAPVTLQTLNVLDARVKDGTVYDRITDDSCASVAGEVLFGSGVLASDAFVVTLTDQTGAAVSSESFLAPQSESVAGFGDIDACDLKDGIISVTVTVTHDGDVQNPMTGTPAAKSSASLAAPVLDPVDPATVFSTIDVCGTAPAGTLVQINGGSGLASTQLTTGQTRFCLEVPLRRNTENTLIISATDMGSGQTASAVPVKVTQVDPSSVLIAQASSRPLTQVEVETLVEKGVIDLNDPSNFNVSMFTIVLTIGQLPVTITQPVVVSPKPASVSYGGSFSTGGSSWIGGIGSGGSSSGGGGSVSSSPVISNSGRSTQVIIIQTPTGQTIPGVIIIDGRIKTLKEFFQVTIAIQNTTSQFDLIDMTADIALPSGLSPVKAGIGTDVADINTTDSVDSVTIGTIGPRQTGAGQFIVRGDGIGDHDITVNFQGFLSGGGLADPFPLSGSAGTSVQVFGPPTLEVSAIHPSQVSLNELYTLTINVKNTSPVPALYTSLDLLLGQGAVLVDNDGNPLPDSSAVRNLGHIQPGQTISQAFLVKSKLDGEVIACQAVASENITLTVDVGGLSCNIANTIPVNFEFPPANAPPTIMAINPRNNQPNVPTTTSLMAVLTPQAGCLTVDSWTNVATDWIDPLSPQKGVQVVSANLVNSGTFYLEEMDNSGNPVRRIPTDLTVTPGLGGNTSIAVLRLGLAGPLSQYFLKPNTFYRATLIGGSEGICNADQSSTRLPNNYQWTFSTAQSCSGIAPPTATLSQPGDGAVDRPLNQKIVLDFSQRMDTAGFTFDPDTPANSSFLVFSGGTASGGDVTSGEPIPGTVAFSNLFQTLTFTPASNLPAGETIYVRLKDTIKDVCGKSLQTPANGIQLFSFTTIPPDSTPPDPPVVNPLPPITNQSVIQVSGTAEVGSLVTITGGAAPVSATTSSDGFFSATVNLNPNDSNVLQITATDASNNVSAPTTADRNNADLMVIHDAVPPMITSVTPVDGSTGVARDMVINVVFSKDIDPDTINNLNFSLSEASTIPGIFTLNGTKGFTFTPSALLDYNQTYSIQMRAGGIGDIVGNTLANTFSSAFATETFPDSTLTEVTPTNGVQGTTFNVVFTGAQLATAGAVVSDNPGVSGSIIERSDTSVTAAITITESATTGVTTLGLTTDGGAVTLPFTVNQKAPVITTITPNQGAQGSTFTVTFIGTNLATAGAVVSDNPGVSGVISSKTDTSVTASITITSAAATGVTTLGLNTWGGTVKLPFTVNPIEPSSLIGHWTFDEGSGLSAEDSSGNGRAGALIAAPEGSEPTWINDGASGNALHFDGSGYVDITNSANLNFGGKEFTMAAWVRYGTLGPAEYIIVGKHFVGYPNGYFIEVGGNPHFTVNATNKLAFFSNQDSTRIITSQAYNDNEWHLVVGTNDGFTGKLYVDNQYIGASPGVPINNTANLRIGGALQSSGSLGLFFSGDIDDVRMYDKALTQSEITQLYQSFNQPSTFHSCLDVRQAGLPDGIYSIDPDGNGNFVDVYCPASSPYVAPVITSITPTQENQNSAVDATISGSGLANITGLSINGEGVTITNLGTGNDNHLNVRLIIADEADPGERTITVTTPEGVATGTFTIVQNPPVITTITPNQGAQGSTFTVTFIGTNLATAGAVVSDNPGVSGVISNKTDTAVTAAITIDPQATVGATTLGLTISGGTVKLPFTINLTSTVPPVIAINAGYYSGYALKSNGTVWAWGLNNYGQLGNNSTINSSVPVQVANLTGVTAIAGGRSTGYALKSNGTVWAWGANFLDQLGNGNNNSSYDSYVPVQVANLTGVTAIDGGKYTGHALKSDGSVWAWGTDLMTIISSAPRQVANLAGVTAIASGGNTSYALKSGGSVWAWGDNSTGQLGDNSTTDRYIPVQVANLTGVIAIASGEYTGYALKSDGTVWAWGHNPYGQLGNNSTIDSSVPVQVANLTDVIAIAGEGNTGYALKSDGSVWAWGFNAYGQLGNNSVTDSPVPVSVTNLTGVTAIAGSGFAGYALKSDGTIWSWGRNDYGQLGNNSTTSSSVPMQVLFP